MSWPDSRRHGERMSSNQTSGYRITRAGRYSGDARDVGRGDKNTNEKGKGRARRAFSISCWKVTRCEVCMGVLCIDVCGVPLSLLTDSKLLQEHLSCRSEIVISWLDMSTSRLDSSAPVARKMSLQGQQPITSISHLPSRKKRSRKVSASVNLCQSSILLLMAIHKHLNHMLATAVSKEVTQCTCKCKSVPI